MKKCLLCQAILSLLLKLAKLLVGSWSLINERKRERCLIRVDFFFRDAAIALFEFYQGIVQTEYREMIDILSKGPEGFTEYDRDRMQEIQNSIMEREAPLDNELQAAQRELAERYNFKIQENKYKKQIDGR